MELEEEIKSFHLLGWILYFLSDIVEVIPTVVGP